MYVCSMVRTLKRDFHLRDYFSVDLQWNFVKITKIRNKLVKNIKNYIILLLKITNKFFFQIYYRFTIIVFWSPMKNVSVDVNNFNI